MSYDRLYYTIGQVSKISALPQSVLRYWETVFESLNPPKSDGGTRQYTEKDVEIILDIKKLLYDEGYTIKGANKHIKGKYINPGEPDTKNTNANLTENFVSDQEPKTSIDKDTVDYIKNRINSIIQLLDD